MKNHITTSTRRDFLKSSAVLASALTLPRVSAETKTASSPRPGARGLLFDPTDLPRIRKNLEHPRFQELRHELLEADLADDRDFLKNKVRLTDHVYDQSRVRRILERSAMAYVLTEDAAQLELVRTAMGKLFEFKKWDYFLEGGQQVVGIQRASESTIAVIFALDWLGDALSPSLRAEAEQQVAEKGARACFTMLYGCKYPDRVRGWALDPEEHFPISIDAKRWPLILNATNLKTIPLAALGIAACWLRGRHPEAESWLNLARDSARAFSVMFGADGSYEEGVGYWGYTALHLVLFAEVLWRSQGVDDRSLVNYPGMARFVLAMSMPTRGETLPPPPGQNSAVIEPRYDLVNFSDSGTVVDVSVMPWISRTHNSGLAQYVAANTGALRSQYSLVWFDSTRAEEKPSAALLDTRLSNEWVISRTGWELDDSVVALRSGGPSNHEHADRNSVIFKAHGERLFHDPFRAGYDQHQARWKLRQTNAHTAVLIDGRGHQYHDGSEGTNSSWAWAHLRDYRTGPSWMTATSDSTEAYALVDDEVRMIDRTVVYLKPDVLLLFDRVKFKTKPKSVQLRFQVYNDDRLGSASVSGSTFRIQRPNAELHAEVYSAQAISLLTTRLDLPEEIGIYPLVEVQSVPALEHHLLTVCSAVPKGQAGGSLKVDTRVAGQWVVSGQHRGQDVRAVVKVTGDALPVITL